VKLKRVFSSPGPKGLLKKVEDTIGVMKSGKLKDRQHNEQMRNNDLQNTTQKTKD